MPLKLFSISHSINHTYSQKSHKNLISNAASFHTALMYILLFCVCSPIQAGYTALIIATVKNNENVSSLLIEKGANVNLQDDVRRCTLHGVGTHDQKESYIYSHTECMCRLRLLTCRVGRSEGCIIMYS